MSEGSEFTKYRRTQIAEMRPYVLGEDLTDVSLTVADREEPEEPCGSLAHRGEVLRG